jgi:hypothetical protein
MPAARRAASPADEGQVPAGIPEAPPPDPADRARKLRAEAAAIEAAAQPDHVLLKVEPPHVMFSYAGVEIGPDWTPVHTSLAPAVLRAAAGTPGVTVTQEGG